MKKIIFTAAIAALSLTSCEDMLSPESDMVVFEEDHTLSSVNDTLYSVMGVVHLMQQVADRTNLLGEVRADLVRVTDAATTDLQALASNTATTDNAYNRPEDYYAIVNNCNYFIQTADTGYTKYGQKVFERELAVMHTFRAWAYLQLAINYGEIPFYTNFLGTLTSAEEVMRQPRQGIQQVCNWLIDDLRPFISTYELDYGVINGYSSLRYFIPVRVMLGELCLWAGRYQEAAQYYHDYLTELDNPRPIGRHEVSWYPEVPAQAIINSYSANLFGVGDGQESITIIPMEQNVFDGTISYLEDVYCSTHDNDYFYELTWSEALIQLSASQAYYYEYEDQSTHKRDTICMSTDSVKSIYTDRKRHGDLRLYSLANETSVGSGTKYNETYQTIRKHDGNLYVQLYRLCTIYLHYAEALNRAGFPSAAFAILKYGLCNDNTMRPEGDVIAAYERENGGELFSFRMQDFTKQNTYGIHSRGCGDSYANPEYVLPVDASLSPEQQIAMQQPWVEDRIVEELALETCFEGQRFYDLMRVALRRNDPAYLADPIAKRLDPQQPDEALRARLMDQRNWYLPLK